MLAALAFTAAILAAPTGDAGDHTVCKAPPPAPGQIVSGPVLHVPSADVLCVATGPSPETWAPVPLAHPAASRGALMSAAFSENVVCAVGSDGRAVCQVGHEALAHKIDHIRINAAMQWR
jgi:hypothetical protein